MNFNSVCKSLVWVVWEGMFVGGLCCADGLALIAPSAHALRRMLQVCSNFTSEKNVVFNAGNSTHLFQFIHSSVVVDEWV